MWKTRMCKYGVNCRYKECAFIHLGEDIGSLNRMWDRGTDTDIKELANLLRGRLPLGYCYCPQLITDMNLIVHKDDPNPHKHERNRFARRLATDPEVKDRIGDALSYYEHLSLEAEAATKIEREPGEWVPAKASAPIVETAPAVEVAPVPEAVRTAEAAAEAARVAEATAEATRKAPIDALVAALLKGKTKEGLREVGRMIEKKFKVSIMKNTSTLNHARLHAHIAKAARDNYPRWTTA